MKNTGEKFAVPNKMLSSVNTPQDIYAMPYNNSKNSIYNTLMLQSGESNVAQTEKGLRPSTQ